MKSGTILVDAKIGLCSQVTRGSQLLKLRLPRDEYGSLVTDARRKETLSTGAPEHLARGSASAARETSQHRSNINQAGSVAGT